jgi:hypothetical protein
MSSRKRILAILTESIAGVCGLAKTECAVVQYWELEIVLLEEYTINKGGLKPFQ